MSAQPSADSCGIIYAGTRQGVETLTAKLQAQNYRVRAYHAGLSFNERREVQHLFRHDAIDIVVATLAFGMGIDKSNVRFVIHVDLPKTIESYYQETGRAGRDGVISRALMLFDPADSARLRGWINALPQAQQQRIEHHKLNHMIAFATATSCRRQILLSYFDETLHQPCGFCDICDNPPVTVDATLVAQKFLSCVYRVKQNYGLNHIIDVLRGSESEKIKNVGHQHLSTFGIGKDQSLDYWKHIAWQLIHRNYCEQDPNHFNVLRLRPEAKTILLNQEKVYLTEWVDKPKSSPKAIARAPTLSSPLFEKLRALRRRLAEEESKPPFLIFSDATLHDMIRVMPKTPEQLLSVLGVGQHKLALYGPYFLELLKQANYDTECQ